MSGKYDDMLYMPHHTSPNRPKMSTVTRGAQFSPFAALVGYDAVIEETARLTQRRIDLTEGVRYALNEKLRMLSEQIADAPVVTITFFYPDLRKDGGTYVNAVGQVQKIDPIDRQVLMADGTKIFMEDIVAIESDWFHVQRTDDDH